MKTENEKTFKKLNEKKTAENFTRARIYADCFSSISSTAIAKVKAFRFGN